MSKKQPPRVQLHFEPDDIVADVNLETEESDPNFVYDDEQSMPEGAAMPEVVEKKSIVQEDIFDLPSLGVMPDKIREDLIIDEMEEQLETREIGAPRPKQGKVTKSGKARKPMTEAHKAKLALAREKAMLVRKAKAEERKKDKAMDSETKQLQKLKKEKDFHKLKKQVIDDEPLEPEPAPAPLMKQTSGLTRADLEQAQFDAIMKYEILRKDRKEEKKKQQKLESQQQEIMNKLAPPTSGYRSRNSQGRLNNRWDNCY